MSADTDLRMFERCPLCAVWVASANLADSVEYGPCCPDCAAGLCASCRTAPTAKDCSICECCAETQGLSAILSLLGSGVKVRAYDPAIDDVRSVAAIARGLRMLNGQLFLMLTHPEICMTGTGPEWTWHIYRTEATTIISIEHCLPMPDNWLQDGNLADWSRMLDWLWLALEDDSDSISAAQAEQNRADEEDEILFALDEEDVYEEAYYNDEDDCDKDNEDDTDSDEDDVPDAPAEPPSLGEEFRP